jgi:hypothetical protein
MKNETEKTEDMAKTPDPVADAVLSLLKAGKPLTFQAAAQSIAEEKRKPKDPPHLWKKYLTAVRQQAIHLARSGKLELIHRGEVVDPGDFKGLVHMRLPSKGTNKKSDKA